MEFNFVSETSDDILTFTKYLLAKAKYGIDLDELGQVIFKPNQKMSEMQPTFSFNDDNSSIIHSSISIEKDVYEIPNVVEVLYSSKNKQYYYRAVNDNEDSEISVPARGREIIHSMINPNISGDINAENIKEYAENVLEQASSFEFKVSYTHGYCPVSIGDCIRLNYTKAGLNNVKAFVTSQTIECETGCRVSETAVYTKNLWR